MEYLEERFPQVRLLPTDLELRARVRQIVAIIACDIQPVQVLRLKKTKRD